MQTKQGYIYKIIFPDGSVYIGSTRQSVRKRISNHISSLRLNKNPVHSLIKPFKKYGWRKSGKRHVFNASIVAIPVEAETRKALRQHEQAHMDETSYHKLLNMRRTDDKSIKQHDLINTPVDCSAWVSLLYPETETNEVTKAA